MANRTSSSPTRTPATGAATRPRYAFWVRVATTAAMNAPANSWPSIAMLMMPECSHSSPESEPKTSGVARKSDPARSPVTGSGWTLSATAQVRNAKTSARPKTIGNQGPTWRRLRVAKNDTTAHARARTVRAIAVVFEWTATGSIAKKSVPVANVNLVVFPLAGSRPNSTRDATAMPPYRAGVRHLIGCSAWARDDGPGAAAVPRGGAVTVLTRRPP